MNDAPHPALLPGGLYDLLPPEAEIEAAVTARLMGVLGTYGYERVKPPLVEFEETLLSEAGAAMASDTFRTMDPISHRMIGVRADMTPQVARIAATRLSHKPRPLRLSYAGQVLRVKGSQMRPERQIGQAGAELIGASGPAADVEVIAVAGEALAALGVPHLSVDLTLPTLVPAIAEAYGITGERARLERERLGAVLDGLAATIPALKVTVDPVENRGFEYHTGISFTFFARVGPELGPLGELGRGGRYQAGAPDVPEPATGFTLYTDTVLRTLPAPPPRRRMLVPPDTDPARARTLRAEGWITVAALLPAADWRKEARRLDCGHVLEKGAPHPVGR